MGISRPFPRLPVRLSTLVSRAPKAAKFKIGYDSDGTPRHCFVVDIKPIILKKPLEAPFTLLKTASAKSLHKFKLDLKDLGKSHGLNFRAQFFCPS